MWTALSLAIGVELLIQQDEAAQSLQNALRAAHEWRSTRPVEGPSPNQVNELEQDLRVPPPPAMPPAVRLAVPGPWPYTLPAIAQPPVWDPMMDPETRMWLEREAIRWAELRRQALWTRLAPWEVYRDVQIPWPATAAAPPVDPPWRWSHMPPWMPLHQPLTVQFNSDDTYAAFRRMHQHGVREGMHWITEPRIPAPAADEEAPPAFHERWSDVIAGVRSATR